MIVFDFIKKIFSFIQTYFKTVVFLTILAFISFSSSDDDNLGNSNLMEIKIKGMISDTTKYEKMFDKASKDNIKGVLVNIDSPGGQVPQSIEIAYMIKELQKSKPVIVYASGTLASGSYYASIYANRIIANPGSLVGSIGVIMISANIEGLMEKIGIQPNIVQAGKYKTMGLPLKKANPYEKEMLQSLINDTYNQFVADVASARGLNPKNHTVFADGKVFLASKAKEVGLIDEVATILRAKTLVIEKSKVKVPIWRNSDDEEDFFSKLKNIKPDAIISLSQRYMF